MSEVVSQFNIPTFMKVDSVERLINYKFGLNSAQESDRVEINETHIVALFKYRFSDRVYIEYAPIINPLRNELDDIYARCDDEELEMDSVNELLDLYPELIEVLKGKDFCENLKGAFQGIEGKDSTRFFYAEDLDEEGKAKEILEDKTWLKKHLQQRDLPYALDETINTLKKLNNIKAFSHRKRGWLQPAFNITDDFNIQFITNFGYGSSSYFYTKLKFRNIDLVPFSDWVVYSNGAIYEIIEYTKSYRVDNNSWLTAMEDVRDSVNLFYEDSDAFIETYIISECELLINGLKSIFENRDGFPYYAHFQNVLKDEHKFESLRLLNEYRGNKITGTLEFVEKIRECGVVIDSDRYIGEIVSINKKIKPELASEIQSLRLEVEDLEVEFLEAKKNLEIISKDYLPINKVNIRINKIMSAMLRKGVKYDGAIRELFSKKYTGYVELMKEYHKRESLVRKISVYKERLETLLKKFEGYENKIASFLKEYEKEIGS